MKKLINTTYRFLSRFANDIDDEKYYHGPRAQLLYTVLYLAVQVLMLPLASIADSSGNFNGIPNLQISKAIISATVNELLHA